MFCLVSESPAKLGGGDKHFFFLTIKSIPSLVDLNYEGYHFLSRDMDFRMSIVGFLVPGSPREYYENK